VSLRLTSDYRSAGFLHGTAIHECNNGANCEAALWSAWILLLNTSRRSPILKLVDKSPHGNAEVGSVQSHTVVRFAAIVQFHLIAHEDVI
ncbi:MAG TPA: hypothetical protein PKA37_18595, partial [Planctomycetota bacterium]|nr:hypothetical protein [Planctomycetota bacterium]